MFYVLEAVNIAAILLMLSMLVVVIRQQPSRAQMAFVLYDVFTVIFVIGVQLELMHADTVGEALSGLCVSDILDTETAQRFSYRICMHQF